MTAPLRFPISDLAAARLAFRSPDPLPLDVLDTAAQLLRHSPCPDDRTIAREWSAALARDMTCEIRDARRSLRRLYAAAAVSLFAIWIAPTLAALLVSGRLW